MRKRERQQLQDMVLQWTLFWGVVGLALGLVQVLRTGAISWILTLGLGAAAGGIGTGILYAGLMMLTEDWRDSLADTPGFFSQAGPQLICGAVAGLIPGLVVGGFGGAIFFGALGACSAAVVNWRSVREGIRRPVAERKIANPKGATRR